MNKQKLLLLLTAIICCGLQAQITFRLPKAANQNYSFVLENGFKRDTVANGTFDTQGNATVVIPTEYAGYRGAGKLLLANDKGLINMIVSNEKEMVVHSPESSEGFENIVYQNSPENEALLQFLTEQNQILQQYLPLREQISTLFPTSPDFSQMVEKVTVLEANYEDLNRRIAETPLYAGKMLQILRYLTFTASSPAQSPEKTAAELEDFIVNKLNFDDLYTSGFWDAMFRVWYEANINSSDSLLVADARTMLQRTDNVEVNRSLSQALINVLSRYGRREYLLPQIVSNINFPLNGQPAPALVIGGDTILPKSTLILFYDSDCGNCHNELYNLAEKYNLLKNNNLRVISIAADADKDMFAETAQKIVWQDNYCDFKGFEGDNFINYGVVGTPTFILIDSEGIVRGRYAQLRELIKD
ncbi:MAG: redoxin domain-containing protein [Prevotellaceae bacterium]|jgi:hypothetical protein|nr:redoxin domain-containing protein [Prevotellaceae bacterium]